MPGAHPHPNPPPEGEGTFNRHPWKCRGDALSLPGGRGNSLKTLQGLSPGRRMVAFLMTYSIVDQCPNLGPPRRGRRPYRRTHRRGSAVGQLQAVVSLYIQVRIAQNRGAGSALDDDLPVEVPVVHRLVGRGHIIQWKHAAGYASQRTVAHHLHEIGEGAVAAPPAPHEM